MEILFETARMKVRQLKLSDLPAFHEMQHNPAVMKYVGNKTFSLDENKDDLQRVINYYSVPENQFWVWAIVSKDTQEFLGTCALVGEEENAFEIGYRFSQKHWGNGYGLEILNGLINFAFENLKIEKLVAYVDVNNKASIKILDESPLVFQKVFYNQQESCFDRFYLLKSTEFFS